VARSASQSSAVLNPAAVATRLRSDNVYESVNAEFVGEGQEVLGGLFA
jgi:hypothetical protein